MSVADQTDDATPVRDQRRAAFCYQTHDAIDIIRVHFAGAKLTTALAIYLVLTESANRAGGAIARGSFEAVRGEIANAAGVSVDTLDRYVKEFEKVGLMAVERRRVGTVNLPNLWSLTESPSAPPSRMGAATPSRMGAATPSRMGAATLAAPVRPLARDQSLEVKEVTTKKKSNMRVDGKTASDSEITFAEFVLAAWNGRTGQNLNAKSWLSKIIMRHREHPELTLEDHVAIIDRNLAEPWWRGAPTPSVIYGNDGIFERSMQTSGGDGALSGDMVEEALRG